MIVERWGDDLAIRLPTELVDSLQLHEGDEIELRVAGPGLLEIIRVRSDPSIFAERAGPADEEAVRKL